MNRHLTLGKEVICAAVVLAAVAWIPSTSLAQLGNVLTPIPTGPGYPVFDAAVANNTDISATSLITTTAGGWYNPPASLLGNLNQTLFSGINSQNAAQLMPVTQGLPCDSYDPLVSTIAPTLAQTYEAAISETQQLTTELQGENFSGIAANIQAPAELASTQGNGQASMAIVQELQLMRAQLAALTMVIATDDLHQLDTTVRPLLPRTGGGC
jgi:hypothetical protein